MIKILRKFFIFICMILILGTLSGSSNVNINYSFNNTIVKISSEVIQGPAVLYKNMILFANGHTQAEYEKYKNPDNPIALNYPNKTTGVYYIDNGKIDKNQWEGKSQFRLMEKNKSGLFFGGCYTYPFFNLLVKFDFTNYSFTQIADIYSENYIEVFNNQYTWTYKGLNEGIVETDKNENITKYFFDDLLGKNSLYSLHITNKCLWSVWAGYDEEEQEVINPKGVSYMDLKTKKWTHFLGYTKDELLKKDLVPMLSGFIEYATCADDNGDLYVLCYNNDSYRIVRYNYEKSLWENFIETNDIFNCYGKNVFLFLKNHVIMNIGTSVNIINKNSKKIEKTYMDGFFTYQIMTDANEETLFFCTNKGIYTQKLTE